MLIVHELIMRPEMGQEAAAVEALTELGAVFAREPGYVSGHTLDGLAEGGLLARVSLWQDRQAAERAIRADHITAVRERLEALAQPSSLAPLLEIVSERLAAAPVVA